MNINFHAKMHEMKGYFSKFLDQSGFRKGPEKQVGFKWVGGLKF